MEVYINPDDIETYIKDYSKKNIDFVFSNYIKVQCKEEYICNFFISGKQCKVKFYVKVKKMSVKMMPIGKNAEESNKLIKYLAQLGYPIDSVQPKQTVFSCDTVLSFNWNKTELLGWHTGLVNDLLTYHRIDLNDFLPAKSTLTNELEKIK